jgi:hypothetical protein
VTRCPAVRLVLRIESLGRCGTCGTTRYAAGELVLGGARYDLLTCGRGCTATRPHVAAGRSRDRSEPDTSGTST